MAGLCGFVWNVRGGAKATHRSVVKKLKYFTSIIDSENWCCLTTSLDIEVLFSSSKSLKPNISKMKFGKYEITTVPTIKESFADTKESWLLRFQDVWKENQSYSNPEKEADYILSFISVLFGSNIEYVAAKSNNVQVSMNQKRPSNLEGTIESLPNMEELMKKLDSLDSDMLRQFLRSCNAYRAAMSLVRDNPTLSFFLLVTSIEAISGKVIRKTDRLNFVEFILKYVPEALRREVGDEKLLLSLIKQAYDMRCAFTHGGTSISIGSSYADQTNRIYVKHYVENKEVRSPSLRWFEVVVRSTLLSFLEKLGTSNSDEPKLPQLAQEKAVMHVKAAKTLQAGRILTSDDLDLK